MKLLESQYHNLSKARSLKRQKCEFIGRENGTIRKEACRSVGKTEGRSLEIDRWADESNEFRYYLNSRKAQKCTERIEERR